MLNYVFIFIILGCFETEMYKVELVSVLLSLPVLRCFSFYMQLLFLRNKCSNAKSMSIASFFLLALTLFMALKSFAAYPLKCSCSFHCEGQQRTKWQWICSIAESMVFERKLDKIYPYNIFIYSPKMSKETEYLYMYMCVCVSIVCVSIIYVCHTDIYAVFCQIKKRLDAIKCVVRL